MALPAHEERAFAEIIAHMDGVRTTAKTPLRCLLTDVFWIGMLLTSITVGLILVMFACTDIHPLLSLVLLVFLVYVTYTVGRKVLHARKLYTKGATGG